MGKGKRFRKRLREKLHRKKDKEEVTYQYYSNMPDEVKLPPHLRKIFDYATNYANAASMYESHLIKPSKKVKEQLDSRYIKIRIKKDKIKKIKPVKSIPVEKLKEYEEKVRLEEGGIVIKPMLAIQPPETLYEAGDSIEDITKVVEEASKDHYNPLGKVKLTESMKKRLFSTRKSEDKD